MIRFVTIQRIILMRVIVWISVKKRCWVMIIVIKFVMTKNIIMTMEIAK